LPIGRPETKSQDSLREANTAQFKDGNTPRHHRRWCPSTLEAQKNNPLVLHNDDRYSKSQSHVFSRLL